MVYIILGNGFEEIEAIATCDILRRGGVEVMLAGVGGREITGGHGITVKADCLAADIDIKNAEMLVVPGGMGGVKSIEGSRIALEKLAQAHERGVRLGAICAGPGVLARLGMLRGVKAVCYPGLENTMNGGIMDKRSSAVTDRLITTGRGPGASLDFGLELLRVLRGDEAALKAAAELVYPAR